MLARVGVLVTGGEHVGPLAVVRALRAAGHEPWALIPDRTSYAALSRASAGWRISSDPVAAVREIRADAVLPGTEPDLVLLAGRREDLPPTLVGAPEPVLVARATDKTLLPELARIAGLETPATREVARADAVSAANDLAYPVMIKPVRSDVDGAHGIPQRADDDRGVSRAVNSLPGDRVLVQPFLDGTLAAVCGVAWNGELVCAVHQQARGIWPPHAGISAFAETVPRDSPLED